MKTGGSDIFNIKFAIRIKNALRVLTHDEVTVGKWRKDGMKVLLYSKKDHRLNWSFLVNWVTGLEVLEALFLQILA